MSEPQFLPEGYLDRGCDVRRSLRETMARMIARPAKSALLTLALGMIAGSLIRAALVRHSGPNQAGAAYHIATQPAQPSPSR